jgi:hypothetical protein
MNKVYPPTISDSQAADCIRLMHDLAKLRQRSDDVWGSLPPLERFTDTADLIDDAIGSIAYFLEDAYLGFSDADRR